MNIHTPLPFSFATNKGTKSSLKLHGIDAQMHKAGLNKPNLPKNTVLISNDTYNINYRIQWANYDYALVTYNKPNAYGNGRTFISGGSPTIEQHEKFMESVKTLHHMAVQLFSL